jgi:hypothetical protein
MATRIAPVVVRSLAYARRGPRGCKPEGFVDGKGTLDRAFCDQSVADVGEACAAEGFGACVGEPCKRGDHGLLCRKG